jgi:hypothetical protein
MDAEGAPPLERRRDRTTETLGALTRLLDAARRQSRLEAVSVADVSGLLLAGAGPVRLCEELAAWAPVVERPADNDTRPNSLDVLERRTVRRRVALDGYEVLVVTAGSEPSPAPVLDQLSDGLRRILGSAL